jgi:purine-binding chemotaxis protein CheW
MSSPSTSAHPMTGVDGTYLTFDLGGEEYAFGILAVRELVAALPLTPIPGASHAVLGMCNLRGRVLPVVSLRLRLGLPPAPMSATSVFIIVEHGAQAIGLAVDRVLEVVAVTAKDIEPVPAYVVDISTAFVKALAKAEGKLRILVDLPRVLDLSFSGEAVAAAPVDAAAAPHAPTP